MLSSENRANRKYITSLLANEYVLTFCIFIIWMTFFDKNNLITLRCLQQTIDQLEDERDFFDSELTELDEQMYAIEIDRERYAREKFYLHKSDEVVYLIR